MVPVFLLALLSAASWKLEFVSDYNVPTGTPVEALDTLRPDGTGPKAAVEIPREELLRRKSSGGFGGISAMAYRGGTLWALSDSSKPVFFTLKLDVEAGRLRLSQGTVTYFADEQGQPPAPWTLDPEGMVLTSRGTLLVVSEGYPARKPPVEAGLFEFAPDGRMLRRFEVPEKYLTSQDAPRGVRPNASFEGLSLSPDGTRLFAATEGALLQEPPACSVTSACTARILEYAVDGESLKPVAEYAYPVEALAMPPEMSHASGAFGVSEILALNSRELLVLERGYAVESESKRAATKTLIYHAELRDGAVRKTLLLDLGDVVERFSPGYRSLDNFEGMCFGPRLADGSRSVLLVSDNNYMEHQRTAFVLLRLRAAGDAGTRVRPAHGQSRRN